MSDIIKYETKDGQSIELSFDMIKKYLVQGKPELVTKQEMMYFSGICRARGLNPFNKDCYLVKYDSSPAAIIVSIDFKRKLAREQRDCRGWSSGIIVKRGEEIVYSKGLMLPDDILLGGWFRATPDGHTEPTEVEVNLAGFIKKTKDGRTTQFWAKEKQPMMIQKVAESQGLSKAWPKDLAKLHTEEELRPSDDDIVIKDTPVMEGVNINADLTPTELGEGDLVDAELNFDTLAKNEGLDTPEFENFVSLTAKANGVGVDELKIGAAEHFQGLVNAYNAWKDQQKPKKKTKPGEKDHVKLIPCPKNNWEAVESTECETCSEQKPCPGMEEAEANNNS